MRAIEVNSSAGDSDCHALGFARLTHSYSLVGPAVNFHTGVPFDETLSLNPIWISRSPLKHPSVTASKATEAFSYFPLVTTILILDNYLLLNSS